MEEIFIQKSGLICENKITHKEIKEHLRDVKFFLSTQGLTHEEQNRIEAYIKWLEDVKSVAEVVGFM